MRPVGQGVFEATMSRDWWVLRGPHGGYLAAVLLRALTAGLGDGSRAVRSFTTHFVRPPGEGPLRIAVEIERSGRSVSYVSARASQDGGPVSVSLAAFSVPWPGPEHDRAPMPPAKSPEEGLRGGPGRFVPPFVRHCEFSLVIGDAPFSRSAEALSGGWMRLREPSPIDACTVAFFADAWFPAVFPVLEGQSMIAPTLDLTVHFRTPLPLAGSRPGDWFLGRFDSRLMRDGFFDESGEIWAPDGTLVAQSRQLALTLPVPG